MIRRLLHAAILFAVNLAAGSARAVERFPAPDFESGYTFLPTIVPPALPPWREYFDVAVLAIALGVSAWLALRQRSRRGLWLLGVFSLLYFGFFREGCVCPVGSIQNVAEAVANPSYAIPLAVVLIFLLPLLFALFFGRVFCAAVCPLGAIQDLVILKPIRLPRVVSAVLGLFPWLYLVSAILLTALGADYLVCRYDPFVGFFRFGGPLGVMLFGAALLAVGLVVARPYCRFLCPYGALLSLFSRLSWRHATIAPDRCVTCRLCERSCPFDAIRPAVLEPPVEVVARARRRFRLAFLAAPALVALFAVMGHAFHPGLARFHATVRLADQVRLEEAHPGRVVATVESDAFRDLNESRDALMAAAARIEDRFAVGGAIAGALFGLMVAVPLAMSNRPRRDTEYTPDRGDCLSCGRCFESCPREQLRLRQPATPTQGASSHG